MEAESQQLSQESQLADLPQDNSGSVHHFDQLDGHCIVCRRAFPLENEASEGFEAICICRECKMIVLDDLETTVPMRGSRRRRQQRGRSRYGSSESIEDLFSEQFSQLISLVRQNHEAQFEGDTTLATHQRASYNTYQSRSRRWQRTLSDNDSDGFDHIDTLFCESDSNISFSGYGGESDASVDGHSLLDREIFIQLDNESHINSDTDIDPMNAGLDQWNSNDQDEDDGEWEEDDIEEDVVGLVEHADHRQYADSSPIGSSGSGAQNGAWIHRRMQENRRIQYRDIFADYEESGIPLYVGNSGDYLDTRGFGELLEQLAETDGSRRGAPPAAATFVGSLPRVVISKDHEKNGSLICAVCKDPLPVDTEANQLPCLHLYHPSCILPWLTARNSCPLCRYELPTDDPDYEDGKRNLGSRTQFDEIRRDVLVEESSSILSSDLEVDEAGEFNHERAEQGNAGHHLEDSSNRESIGRGWLFLAAAPIVGIALVMWFGNPLVDIRDRRQLQRSSWSNSAPERRDNRSRRWWSFFRSY